MNAINGTRPLGALIQEYASLTVEDYQRPYTWEAEQIDDYISDLLDNVREKSHHFFGTLILQSTAEAGCVLVVDGQQRITTTVILVAALRDQLLSQDIHTIPGTADRVATYVPDKVYGFLLVNNQKLNPRFKSNRTIRQLMNDCVLLEKSNGQKSVPIRDRNSGATTLKFRKAVLLIRKKVELELKDLDPVAKLIKIDELLSAILNRFHVLKIDTSSPSESLDIFLTLNNRGAPLGPSDLVRGEVLKRLSFNRSNDEIELLHKQNLDSWNTIVEQVKDADVYLRHFLVATGTSKVQKKKIVDAVVNRIAPTGSTADEQRALANNFWFRLGQHAEHYADLVTPFSESSSLSRFSKEYILLLEGLMKSHRILLLTLLTTPPSDDSDLEELIRLIFVYGFRYYMNGGNAQDLENRFQDWGQNFQETKNVDALKEKLIKEIANNPVGADQYFTGEADGDYVSRALLHIVNHYLSVRTWPLSDYHLEHIAPQTSTPKWLTEIGAGQPPVAEEYDSLVSELGNLTLLDPETNWKIKNWDFAKKKPEYNRGHTNITQDLTSLDYWTRETIAERTEWLKELYALIWSETKPDENAIRQFSARNTP